MNVKNFNDWVSESQQYSLSVSSVQATKNLMENLLQKRGFSDNEKLCLFVVKESNSSLYEWENLNEGLLNKLKEIGQKAVDKGKEFAAEVKDAVGKDLTGIPEFFKALSSGVKNLAIYIKDFLVKVVSTMFSKPYEWTKSAFGGGFSKFESSVKEEAKKDPSRLKEEASGMKNIVKGTSKLLSPEKISDQAQKALIKADTDNIKTSELEIVEESMKTAIIVAMAEAVKHHNIDDIHEGLDFLADNQIDESHSHTRIPFISTMTMILEKLPPFSWLVKLANFIGENANKALTKISETMKNRGAIEKATEFAVMGTLVGLGLEYLIKGGVKSALAWMFPPLKATLVVLGTIATGICVVHVASTVIDGLKDTEHEIHQESKSMVH